MCGPGASLERVPWVPRHIVELGGQDEFYFFMIMLHFNHYINTLASNVKNNPTHESKVMPDFYENRHHT